MESSVTLLLWPLLQGGLFMVVAMMILTSVIKVTQHLIEILRGM